jgi:hypothetical protein
MVELTLSEAEGSFQEWGRSIFQGLSELEVDG